MAARTALSGTAYDVLGVDKSASADDIRKAYRKRARQTHPDTGGNAAEFAEVQQAWELIGTSESRESYDRELAYGPRPSSGGYGAYAAPGAQYGTRATGNSGDESSYWNAYGPGAAWIFQAAEQAAAAQAAARGTSAEGQPPLFTWPGANGQQVRIRPLNRLAPLSFILAFLLPPVGIVVGHVALHQIKRFGQMGRRLALFGLGLSYIMTIVQVLPWILRIIG